MKKILIVAPVECYPSHYGNSARIASFIEFFKSSGLDFCYLHLADRAFDSASMREALGNRYVYRSNHIRRKVLIRLRIRAVFSLLMFKKHRLIKVDDFVDDADIAIYRKVLSDYQPDIVLVNYTYLSKLLLYTPIGIVRIIDTHDSLYLRYQRLYNGKRAINRFRITVKDEIEALNRADKVIGIQEEETRFFLKNGCAASLYTIGHQIPYRPTKIHSRRRRLLYIGANYSANLDALDYFVRYIWPSLTNTFPNLELLIAGTVGEMFVNAQLNGQVKILGQVDSLLDLYNTVDIAINPVRFGSGLKIKNIEALSFGKPLITSSLGVEGLTSFVGKGLEVANTVEEWLQVVEKLLHSKDYYHEILRKAKQEVQQYNEGNLVQMHQLFLE